MFCYKTWQLDITFHSGLISLSFPCPLSSTCLPYCGAVLDHHVSSPRGQCLLEGISTRATGRVRPPPLERTFLVASFTSSPGWRRCWGSWRASSKSQDEHIGFLRNLMPDCEEGFFEYMRSIDCSQVELHAMKEGTM
mmetsp:Transcript_1684/g.3140  ORF Transcript_1684/g.3140 Transcript_1684/m.3140 type:complete len:137 (+) Transcript_1684:39-449(+)